MEDNKYSTTEMYIVEVLKDFGMAAYWYGEETGDYNMCDAESEEFLKEAVRRLSELAEKIEIAEERLWEAKDSKIKFINANPDPLLPKMLEYYRRAKTKNSIGLYKRLHASKDGYALLCGIEITDMWWCEGNDRDDGKMDVTCPKCKKELRSDRRTN